MSRRQPKPARSSSDGSGEPLIDVHAHFLHASCGRSDWDRVNASRLRAGERIGITIHIGSILGSFGATSPTYMPSPVDVTAGNEAMLALARRHQASVRAYVMVNPNDTEGALAEIARGVSAGAVGIKLAASRRADDPLLDPIMRDAALRRLPVLHHIWQHRRRDWPNQEVSDAIELGRLAARHAQVSFILAHIGGGGDWAHSLPAVRELPNVYLDISGSQMDRGMLDAAVATVGARRILFGTDLTMDTGLAKLRALEVMGIGADDMAAIRWRNATRIFPAGSLMTAASARVS